MAPAMGTRPPMPISAGEAKKKAKSAPARRDLLVFLLIFLLIAALGGGAYFYLTKPDASAEALASMKEKLAKAAQIPGKAVENAKEGIAGARGAEQSRVDNVIEGKETPDKRGVGAVSPAEMTAKLKEENPKTEPPKPEKPATPEAPSKVTAGTQAYSGIDTGSNPPPPPPAASARFVKYAEGLSVSGVFQGSPARALVDGRLIRAGEVIEPRLGVSFVGVDAETKHLILQDTTGAQLRIKY